MIDYLSKLQEINLKIDSINVSEMAKINSTSNNNFKEILQLFLEKTSQLKWILIAMYPIIFIILLFTNLSQTTVNVEVYNENEDEMELKNKKQLSIKKTLLWTTLIYFIIVIPLYLVPF